MDATLSTEQLRAIGQMQYDLAAAANAIKRAQHLALEHDINFAGINLDPLRAAYADLCGQVIAHLRTIPTTPGKRKVLAAFHAPAAKVAA